MEDNTISYANIQNRLNRIAQDMGYLNWNFIAFEPYKTVEKQDIQYSHVLSGLQNNTDLYNLTLIFMELLERVKKKCDMDIKEYQA